MYRSNRLYNIICGFLVVFAIVNVCKTGNLQQTIMNTQKTFFSALRPVMSHFVDVDFLEANVTENTQMVLNNEVVQGVMNEWNNSGASEYISKVFAPMISTYGDMELSEYLTEEGIDIESEFADSGETDKSGESDANVNYDEIISESEEQHDDIKSTEIAENNESHNLEGYYFPKIEYIGK